MDTPEIPVTTPADTTPTPVPTDNFKARYDGLNSVFQKEKAAFATQLGAREAAIGALEAEKLQATSQVQDYAKQLEALKAENAKAVERAAELERVAATTQNKLARTTVLMDPKYAHMQQLEKEGLLPTNLTAEEFPDYLAKFTAALGQVSKAAVADAFAGATPSSQAGNVKDASGISVEVLLQQIAEAQRHPQAIVRNTPAYQRVDELMNQYIALQK